MISSSLTDICESAFRKYFTEILTQLSSYGREDILRGLFEQHMHEVALYISENFIEKKGILSEQYIRGLHKICYPPGYTENRKIIGGTITTLVPGLYKSHTQNTDIFRALEPHEVKIAMNRLISEHNEKMLNPSISMEERLREILYFLYRFFIIHPFADANGRIGSILTDSMLIYHGHAPLYFKEKSDNDISFQTAIKKTILEDSFEDFCFTIYH